MILLLPIALFILYLTFELLTTRCRKRRYPAMTQTINRKGLALIIRDTRRTKHMNVRDFAEEFCVSRQTICNYESGYMTPNIEFVIRLADMRGQTVDEIIQTANAITIP